MSNDRLHLDRWFPEPDAFTLADAATTVAQLPAPIERITEVAARVVEVEPWRQDANCRGLAPDVFYPEQGDLVALRLAKEVCAGCRVRVQCLEFALTSGEKHGVWGGVTYSQRRKLSVSSMPATGWPA